MSYILQNNSGLIGVRLTDAGRKKLSQGNLSLSLFQLGDSEFCYDCYTNVLPEASGIFITEPKWNAQNISNVSAERNKQNVKYPVPVLETNAGATYGVLTPSHSEQNVFNVARPRGFFNYDVTGSTIYGDAAYALSSSWCWPMSDTLGTQVMNLATGGCGGVATYWPAVGDIIMVQQLSPYMTSVPGCMGSQTIMPLSNPMPYLFYNVLSATTSGLTTISVVVDRNLPNWAAAPVINGADVSTDCANVIVYPGGKITSYWGQNTPVPYWSPGSLSFDNNCDVSVADVNVWNMNINWTQWDGVSINMGTMAGIDKNIYQNVDGYGSSGYCSTKEYLGYNSDNGQYDSTNIQDQYGLNNVPGYDKETSGTYIRDSFGAIRTITPSEQRMVAILHFTNYTISNFYGEKFALEPDGTVINGIGEMDNFKVHMPHIMWHRKKSTGTGMGDECEMGQTFYIDPPGFSVAEEQYIESKPNPDMNEPGIRYYHLWDDNAALSLDYRTAVPNRVGKVFPDLQMIVIDDQELITAMSHKSNRNWTLPMPKLELVPAGTSCGDSTTVGVFNGAPNTEELYFTYLMGSTSGYTTGLHCNYYNRIVGDTSAGNRDLKINFGTEWPYLRPMNSSSCSFSGTGWNANSFHFIFQKVPYGTYPNPALWSIYNATTQIVSGSTTTPLTSTNMSQNVGGFYMDNNVVAASVPYVLHDYINIPLNNGEPNQLQFGDENFFFGNIETDIMATIYEMKYNVTVSNTQFNTSTNPTWNVGNKVRITEIGLYDSTKDLMAIAKLRTPVKRQGTQTFVIKIDY